MLQRVFTIEMRANQKLHDDEGMSGASRHGNKSSERVLNCCGWSDRSLTSELLGSCLHQSSLTSRSSSTLQRPVILGLFTELPWACPETVVLWENQSVHSLTLAPQLEVQPSIALCRKRDICYSEKTSTLEFFFTYLGIKNIHEIYSTWKMMIWSCSIIFFKKFFFVFYRKFRS